MRYFFLSIVAITYLNSCSLQDRIPPVCRMELRPSLGDSLTVFLFDASGSADNLTDPWFLKVRWDAESDGVWETGWNAGKQFAWKYPANGTYLVSCEVRDESGNIGFASSLITVRNTFRDSVFIDPRDGRAYPAALVLELWWMAENLAYGHPVEDDVIPKKDTITEFYTDRSGLYGGFYLWQEATLGITDTLNGICPPGWRLPKLQDFARINELMYFQSGLEKYLLGEGVLGLDLSLSGRFVRTSGVWDGQGVKSSYWVTNGARPPRFLTWMLYLPSDEEEKIQMLYEGDYGTGSIEGWPRDWGDFNYAKVALPIRCVKDLK